MSWWIRAGNEDGVMLWLHVGIFDDDSSRLPSFARALIFAFRGRSVGAEAVIERHSLFLHVDRPFSCAMLPGISAHICLGQH